MCNEKLNNFAEFKANHKKCFCKRSPLKYEENWFGFDMDYNEFISYIVAFDTFAI